MMFGFQSSKFNSLPLEKELDKAEEFNADFFDIFFDGFLPGDITDNAISRLHQWQTKKPITVHFPIDFFRLDNSEQQQLIDFALFHKAHAVTIHFDEALWEDLLRLYALLSNTGKHNSPMLCIENTVSDSHKDYNLSFIDFMLKSTKYFSINRYLPSNGKPVLYAAIDTGHAKANFYNPVSYINGVLKTGISIGVLHLHDNNGFEDTHEPAGSIPLADNGIDFASIFELCISNTQSPYCVIEQWDKNGETINLLRKLLVRKEIAI